MALMADRQKTRVLLVDDSRTIRALLRAQLADDDRIVIVGEAADPLEARDLIKTLQPDVLTLDVEMPRMNGLDFLERLMRLRPMPVVMISTETHKGSAAAIEALSLGAFDCIGKPGPGRLGTAFTGLADTLIAAAGSRVRTRAMRPLPSARNAYHWGGQIVLIGASTGGVEALEWVLSEFPANCPPTLIAQHMPAAFLSSFAARLAERVAPAVSLAADHLPLKQGHVYLAPGGMTHLTLSGSKNLQCRLVQSDKRNGHWPSVDVLFESAVAHGSNVVAAILTGMGKDGAEGMHDLRRAGAACIVQDEETSVVYGMPRAALENGAAQRAAPLSEIASGILSLSGRSGPEEQHDIV